MKTLTSYKSKVEAKVSKLQWQVTPECKIGIFSFLKINMYHDLMNNQDKILKNDNVRLLLGEPLPINEFMGDAIYSKLDKVLKNLDDVIIDGEIITLKQE